jgi:hypothetical protein
MKQSSFLYNEYFIPDIQQILKETKKSPEQERQIKIIEDLIETEQAGAKNKPISVRKNSFF